MNLKDLVNLPSLHGRESLTEDELNIIMDYEDENSRKGNFYRIFPLASNVDYYERFFEVNRYYNSLLWAYVRGLPESGKVVSK
jgi:hypothetical protein